MRDRKEERRWGVILAREFDVPPDDIDLETFLDCVSRSEIVDDGQLMIVPGNKEEEEVLCGPHAGKIMQKMIAGEHPFNDWLYNSFPPPDKDVYDEGFLN